MKPTVTLPLMAAIAGTLSCLKFADLKNIALLDIPSPEQHRSTAAVPLYVIADRGLRSIALAMDMSLYAAGSTGVLQVCQYVSGSEHLKTLAPLSEHMWQQIHGLRSWLAELNSVQTLSFAVAPFREGVAEATNGFFEHYPSHLSFIGHIDPVLLVVAYIAGCTVFLRELYFFVMAISSRICDRCVFRSKQGRIEDAPVLCS